MNSDILWDQLNGKDITALKIIATNKKAPILHVSICFPFPMNMEQVSTTTLSGPKLTSTLNSNRTMSCHPPQLTIWKAKNFPRIPSCSPHQSPMLSFIAKISDPNNMVLILPSLKRHRCHWQRTREIFWTDWEHSAYQTPREQTQWKGKAS